MSGLGFVNLRLHGVTLRLESQRADFLRYVEVAMAPYLVGGNESVSIASRLVWVDGPPPKSPQAVFGDFQWEARPDRDLFVGNGVAHWCRIDDFPALKLRLGLSSERLEVEGHYHFQIGAERGLEKLRRLRYRSSLPKLEGSRFSTLLYYLVYHPILWALRRKDGWEPLHGAAVTTAHGTLAFSGMPGCGKSTLSVALLGDPANRMLSDNLIVTDGARVLAVPELLLLDDTSLGLAGEGAKRLAPTGETRVFGRDAYRPDEVELTPQVPVAWFCVERSRQTALEVIDSRACAQAILAGNMLAKEVRRLAIMSDVLDVLAGQSTAALSEKVAGVVRDIPCFRLKIGEGDASRRLITEVLTPAVLGAQASPDKSVMTPSSSES